MAAEERYDFIVSTIAPAMNEEGNIDELCRQYAAMLQSAPFKGELILIDDGSTDGTLERMEACAEKYDFVRFASHQLNRGLTEALQTGFSIASGEVFVFYPSDLQYRPEDIPKLVEPIARGADVCTGWKQGQYKKWFVSRLYNWFSRKIFGLKVHDLNSVKAFRREVVEEIFLRKDWHRYLVVLAADRGYRIEEEKIPLYDRQWGESKYSIWRIPVGVLDMLAVKFQITFLKKPLLFFGSLGSALFAIGILVGLWALYLRYVEGHGERAMLYLVLLLLGLGMGFFVMGFIAEGQTAIKEEVSDLRKKTDKMIKRLDGSQRGR